MAYRAIISAVAQLSCICSCYTLKISNDFYGIQNSITIIYARHCTSFSSLSQICVHRINTPDLNPDDYIVWGITRSIFHRPAILDVADLTAAWSQWSGLQERVIDDAHDQQHGQLCACVRTDGRHISYLSCWTDSTVYRVKIVASFDKVQYEHKKGVVGCAHCACFKFPGIYFHLHQINDTSLFKRRLKTELFRRA